MKKTKNKLICSLRKLWRRICQGWARIRYLGRDMDVTVVQAPFQLKSNPKTTADVTELRLKIAEAPSFLTDGVVRCLPKHTNGRFSNPVNVWQIQEGESSATENEPIPPFLVNSLPKSGTHLLEKTVALLPGVSYANIHLDTRLKELLDDTDDLCKMLPAGVDNPRFVPASGVRLLLEKIRPGTYGTAHMPFSCTLSELIEETGIRSLLILRDPRDVVVSNAHYIAQTPGHFLHDRFKAMTLSGQIMVSIVGCEPETSAAAPLANIKVRCESVLPWRSQSFNYTTYFEKLVGPQGGGSRTAQVEEIGSIAEHLNVRLCPEEIPTIAARIFGGTTTFRKGAIGRWKQYFTREHKTTFNDIAGQLLIDLGYETNDAWVI